MPQTSRYRQIEVSGPPRELGRQIGESAREETRGFCEVALERVQKTVAISDARAMEIAEKSTRFAEAYRPDLVDELRGIAEGANVSLLQLMLLQVRNQLTPDAGGACTSLAVTLNDQGSTIVAQTWDNDPALDPFTIVITRRPENRPATMACTQAGLISYMGFGELGIGACVNTLPASSRNVGVPHYFTLRELLESKDIDSAASAVQRAHRAIPANIMVAAPDGPADLEVTVDAVQILRPDGYGHVARRGKGLVHTNHCVHASLCQINDDYPELIQSHARKSRSDELLSRMLHSESQPIEGVKEILRDHDGHPRSICRHANDDAEHGFWETVFALIIEPARQCMHISRGTPCNHAFETYTM